ncbi:unnamed protein product, partial [marine sediment metagenome]
CLIQEQSLREWEKIASKALSNQDISKDLENLFKSGNIEDLIQTMKFMSETNALSKDNLQSMRKQLEKQISNLDQLFNAAKNLGKPPKFNQDQVLENSLNQSSFEHNFNLANSLDQFFGTNLRDSLLEKFKQQAQNAQMNLSLETLTKSALASKSWNSLFQQSLQNAIKDAMNQSKKSEALKSLSHQVQQLMNSCQNIHSSEKISQELPNLVKKTLESCENPEQLRNAVEFLRKVGLQPQSDDIKDIGKKLEMPEDEIYELIEPNYQLLKKLAEKEESDF